LVQSIRRNPSAKTNIAVNRSVSMSGVWCGIQISVVVLPSDHALR
jgi:hypothetical protein